MGICQSFVPVASGDTCGAIAASNGLTLDKLILYNPSVGTSCQNLWTGGQVCVGVAADAAAAAAVNWPAAKGAHTATGCWAWHTVAKEDTVESIVGAYGTDKKTLYGLNPFLSDGYSSLLYPGQQLCI